MLNGLDLFSGGGWLTEALTPWVRPVTYCENDEFAQRVLLSRMFRREIPQAPIWDDVRTLRAGFVPLPIHIIYGGFPCQGHSLAGARRRMADSRSQLFWEIVRLAEEAKPTFIFLENVWPGIRGTVPTIRAALKCVGFECRDGFLSASDVGLPHRRSRWFLLGYSNANGKRQLQQERPVEIVGRWVSDVVDEGSTTADTVRKRRRLQPRWRSWPDGKDPLLTFSNVVAWPDPDTDKKSGPQTELAAVASAMEGDDWHTVARLFCGMDHGKPYRGKRIGVLGNSVPWIQYRQAFQTLAKLG